MERATVIRSFVAIALLAFAAPAVINAQTQQFSLRVRAYIDGSDRLYIRGNQVWYQHVSWKLPGKGDGHDDPTYLNDEAWYPTWNGSGDGAETERHALPKGFGALPTNVAAKVSLENNSSRCEVSISSQPSPSNNYTLALYLSDAQNGAAWCDLTISCAALTISTVTAQQRYPWNGKVDISYTVSGDVAAFVPDGMMAKLKVTATDTLSDTSYTAAALSGDISTTDGTHNIVWDMDADGLSLVSTAVVFTVSCETAPATYCVIDLSAGSSASAYPVTYLAEPPADGFNADEYKTTKLVLKRIEAGTFQMGGQYRTILTKPYYMGIFEVTQKQYQLVTGSTPSNFSGNKRPVEKVSYNAIRGSSTGAGWPASSAVDSTSFMGKLRARTGLDFDLPTEAQWEYACRAGTATAYSYGDNANGSYMWYKDNSSSQTHEVGTKLPNAWGLYDMHGNVWEWCLDWYGSLSSPLSDPTGCSSGSYRVFRGGAWDCYTVNCNSTYRDDRIRPADQYNSVGFRLSRKIESIATYCVIDLSAGANATTYPVTFLSEPPAEGFNVDEYKTTKLALRRIEPGTFMMCGQYQTTLTEPYYIGVFEVTQKQYQLVTGDNPSKFSGDQRPVEMVSYNAIRGSTSGAGWPTSSMVDSTSFMGKLRARTGLSFDLPTEAQWEYACRAGTATTYSYGDSANGNYMWSSDNSSSQTHEVGTKLPNPWGLYDMHGNVLEWCLDWYGTLSSGTDPKGSSSGSRRMLRGGSWYFNAASCTSYYRNINDYPSVVYDGNGFRLSGTAQPISASYTVSFNSNGGSGTMAAQSVVPNVDALNPCTFTRNGYSFSGWALTANGAVTYQDGAIVDIAADTTLYAVWTPTTTAYNYCVIDLSAGANASSYPVTYLTEPPTGGFNVNAYKTTKLVLRRIEPGTFMMCGQYRTTLTKPYYIGIFEVTQKQYSLIMGNNPSYYTGDKRPVEKVTYNIIRGADKGSGWPASSAVDDDSFMGKLRARTGLAFDLPTEAQWEYACRAGTTSDYNNGGNNDSGGSGDSDLDLLGRYMYNQSAGAGGYSSYHTTVGSYQPNAWGLYDMHGNVYEICLDWYYADLSGGTDPKGPTYQGLDRVKRGGSWYSSATDCTSSKRLTSYMATITDGFRIARPLEQ